jgi:serine/threonine protein kinase
LLIAYIIIIIIIIVLNSNINWSSPEQLLGHTEDSMAVQHNDSNFTKNSLVGNPSESSSSNIRISSTPSINQSADVWSLAMVMYEILSGEVPFDTEEFRNMTFEKFIQSLKNGIRPPIPVEFSHLTWFIDLVSTFSYLSILLMICTIII